MSSYARALIEAEANRLEGRAINARKMAKYHELEAVEQREEANRCENDAAELRRWLQKVEVEA